MTTVDDYLAIPEGYGRWLGGLRWSANGEAVEYAADGDEIGLTFAMGGQIAQLLEGLAAGGRFLHFAYVLHILHLLGGGARAGSEARSAPEFQALARAFRKAGHPSRNAGAFFAATCADIPEVPDPPWLSRIRLQLSEGSPMRYAILRRYPGEVPPLTPEEFEAKLLARLRAVSPDELAHWLRHGRGPARGAGEAIARAVPPTLGERIAELERRPRLRNAAALAERLSGALTLPARRLTHAGLPLGGYSDVANRGEPERVLPSQLALDADEFLRRFAERELLYFHREEPHEPSAKELVLVLDQGVRTWGDVRVALSAAALALAKVAGRRGLALRVATTGNGGEAVDFLGADGEAIGTLIEASDLSPHPAEALRRVLAQKPAEDLPREVLLLTHPRSLAEPEVAGAMRTPAAGTRLFAVSANSAGEVTLSEVRRGGPVAIGRCRVDLAAPEPKAPVPAGPASWTGDVEPIGFPFRIGVTHPIDDRLFGFDESGEWLVLADSSGILRAWRTDASGAEMLPMAMVGGRLFSSVRALVGVAGGFVVAGRAGGRHVAAHYDFGRRHCTSYILGSRGVPTDWVYVRPHHCVVGTTRREGPIAIDLTVPPGSKILPVQADASARAKEAVSHGAGAFEPPLVLAEGDTTPASGRAIRLHSSSGVLDLLTDKGEWRSFTPLDDGRPKLLGAKVVRARWHGGILAMLVELPGDKKVVHTFSAPRPWRSLGEFPAARDAADFALSRDGRLLALRSHPRQLQVWEPGQAVFPMLGTHQEPWDGLFAVAFSPRFLAVRTAGHAYLVRWDWGPLKLAAIEGSLRDLLAREGESDAPGLTHIRKADARQAPSSGRFVIRASRFGLDVTLDRLGQVAVSGPEGLIALFSFSRGRGAAWAPDGTRLGPSPLLGGPETPGAAEVLAGRLRAAVRGMEGKSS